MILGVKTEGKDLEVTLFEDGQVVTQRSVDYGRELSMHILEELKNVFESVKKDIQKDITGIVVFQGPGSFTSLRIGITVCNALTYSAHAPIVGTKGEDWLDNGLARLASGEDDKIAMPFYGAEANITKPRK